MSEQQKETKLFFNDYSKQWKNSASLKDGIIQQRNDFVVSIAKEFFNRNLHSYLDAGCGTGELLQEMQNYCQTLTGIDFAPQMIEEAKNLKISKSLDNCNFEVADALNYGDPNSYDLISANGFIEYISLEQLRLFIANCRKNITNNGIISLGSRNRLFNLTTFNEFTHDEYLNEKNVKLLAEEAILLSNPDFTMEEFSKGKASTDYQKSEYTQPKTGITVSQRFQYTPLQLSNLLKEFGFQTIKISGCNFHQMPISLKESDYRAPEESLAHIPFCSTFMIAARKT